MSQRQGEHYDVLVVGSGFGGSVTALRLTEKGYRVGVLEAGRRFTPQTLPRTSWDVRNFLWAPALGCYGIQRIHVLRDVVVLAGAGVGGGSLNYANTLYRPKSDAFYRDPQWASITDWRDELDPFYEQASRMLGVVTQPTVTPSDVVMRTVAEEYGRGDTVSPTEVGVFFGRDGRKEPGARVPDPFFGGAGPERTGCIECGECMTGCRHGAKNTLDRNYLALAESAGAAVHPETTVTTVRPRAGDDGAGGWAVETRATRGRGRRTRTTFTADQVVFSAGTWGTQSLLHRLRDTGVLPRISARLGELTRTNSEALVGAMARRPSPRGGPRDFTRGVAITSSWHPDEDTHIEPCRYGYGSNAMGLLTTLMTDGGGRVPRAAKLVGQMVRHPGKALRSLDKRRWSERTVIALVMQSLDNSITVRRRFGRLVSRQGHGTPNPTWIPAANATTRRMAEFIDGDPGGTLGEAVNMPMTAHFIGGCPIGADADRGVLDPYQRLHGYEGLHVVDGSALSANLGVNPSLTITAQAERAMAFWPNRGDADARPPVGAPYERLAPVAPYRPVVPADAPGALRTVPLGVPTVPRPAPQPVAGS